MVQLGVILPSLQIELLLGFDIDPNVEVRPRYREDEPQIAYVPP